MRLPAPIAFVPFVAITILQCSGGVDGGNRVPIAGAAAAGAAASAPTGSPSSPAMSPASTPSSGGTSTVQSSASTGTSGSSGGSVPTSSSSMAGAGATAGSNAMSTPATDSNQGGSSSADPNPGQGGATPDSTPAAGMAVGNMGGNPPAGGSAAVEPEEPEPSCTDTQPDDRETCSTWAAWGECEADWLAGPGYCDFSCGRCADGETPPGYEPPVVTMGPDLGEDNPYPPINGGSSGWASRYWDCCKPSCAWQSNASSPVMSCDRNDNNLGVTDQPNACEQNGQSGAFTCHSMAPWAHSNQVSYGFAAVNGVQCGQCFQLQFTGTSQNAPNDPGSALISGKTMIVQATNIGGIEQGQFDLLVPGGGVGALNGCSGQWGVDNSQLGAQYGGFLSECREGLGPEDHELIKSCMRDKCEAIFLGDNRNLTELYDGCIWFVDWFQVADNPEFVYQPISCPDELVNVSGARG